ncbi:MAG TPA: serine/threonine-protein kinase [Woeseiaceae bacterium]|nr:serine/threonine-protein kinase [Woeseiaceae bacterium]
MVSASSQDSIEESRRATGKSRPERIVGANEQLPGYGYAAILDITHPLTLNRTTTSNASEIRIDLADSDDNSAELVDLVVKREPHRTSVSPGEVLAGRYVVVERVSHCGMGLVFKALDRRREKAGSPLPWVALKFASLDGESSWATSPYLRQEFLKLSQLNHANVVSVFDFDNDGGLDFIVMEWLEGETLANSLMHITSKRIALDKAEEIITSVGDALAHAHGVGIVHGDVKPSNIFLTDNRTVKLLDFGSSGQTTTADGEIEPHWATRAYASCEVLQGNAPQPRDDVFALGVTAFCLLSGERPFGDLDAAEAKEQSIEPNRLPLDAHEYWHAIRRALNVDAAERSATAKEFMLDFCEPPIEADVSEPRPPLEHLAYGAIAVALLIAIVALTVGSIGGGLPSPEEVALDNAEQAMDAGRLVEPGDESAFAYYSSVLAALPENGEALDGLNRIAEEYLTRARAALAADDPDAAVSHLATASLVRPDHYGIAIVEDLVARHGKDLLVSARQMAGSDLDQAESLLARAAMFLPVEDATLASTRDEFAQRRIDERVESLLTGIDERILSERLTIPRGDSALDLLGEARHLAPDDRLVKLAADRIATALLFQSMFAMSNGTLEEAQEFIDAAKALNVKHLALARAQYELAKARHDVVRTRGSGSE